MNYQFEDTRMQTVAVPARVVDGLLGIATAAQLKVLLFLLRFDKLAHSAEDIARFCNISAEEVESAVDFWVRERVFALEGGKLRLISATKTVQAKELPRVQPTIVLEETGEEFRAMVGEIQRITGKPINSLMVSLFYNMTENLHFSPELVVQIAAYCCRIDKFSYRYMETLAADWYDNGINTFELAEQKIRELEQSRAFERRLAAAFGIKTNFSAKQRETIAAWQKAGYTYEQIIEAYDICMDNIGKMDFRYINTTLNNRAGEKAGEKKPAANTGRKPHSGLSELEQLAISRMQGGKKDE